MASDQQTIDQLVPSRTHGRAVAYKLEHASRHDSLTCGGRQASKLRRIELVAELRRLGVPFEESSRKLELLDAYVSHLHKTARELKPFNPPEQLNDEQMRTATEFLERQAG